MFSNFILFVRVMGGYNKILYLYLNIFGLKLIFIWCIRLFKIRIII